MYLPLTGCVRQVAASLGSVSTALPDARAHCASASAAGASQILSLTAAAVLAAAQVLASADGAPMMQAPGPNTLSTPQGQVLQLPAGWEDKEIKESMQSHFD